MKKLSFKPKNIQALKAYQISNLSSVVGGWKYASSWHSSNGTNGSDTVYWGPGECASHVLISPTGQYIYCDIIFSSIKPSGATTVEFSDYKGTADF